MTGPPSASAVADLVASALAGSVRALARLVTLVENGADVSAELSEALAGRPRAAIIVGLTGPPGVGKSTIVDALVAMARGRSERISVLAVDPSSPFTGGAVLGDRVRMSQHTLDDGVFIRSMSARGRLGGLAAATPAVVELLSALGFDRIIVETVGVGQNEIDVLRLADTVLVVTAPGLGDEVQAAKAGILEIADLLVVNKADREGAAHAVRELQAMIALGRSGTAPAGSWRVPVLSTVARTGDGLADLAGAVDAHRRHLVRSGELATRRRQRAGLALAAGASDRLRQRLQSAAGVAEIARLADEVDSGAQTSHSAANALWAFVTEADSTRADQHRLRE